MEAYDLIWTKLKSGIWWPGVRNMETKDSMDYFTVANSDTIRVTLLGCEKVVYLSIQDEKDENISTNITTNMGNGVSWKSGEFTEDFLHQEVDDSLMISYKLALSFAATKFPNYFKNPEKYIYNSTNVSFVPIESSSTTTTVESILVKSLKRPVTDLDGNFISNEPIKMPIFDDRLLCKPVTTTADSNNGIIGPYNENRSRIKKRSGVISWDDYFMSVAFLSAMRSKDPSTQVGACIVNDDKRIVGIGYNGFPRGCSDDELPWDRTADSELDTKYPYVCHAELNAVLNKNSADVKGCTMYVALFPCNECSKIIIQSGIKEIVYLSDKYHDTVPMIASKRLLNLAGVKYREHKPKLSQILIDFNKI